MREKTHWRVFVPPFPSFRLPGKNAGGGFPQKRREQEKDPFTDLRRLHVWDKTSLYS